MCSRRTVNRHACARRRGYYSRRRQVFPKEWFGEGKRVPFEGLPIPVPDRAEDMLASIYGADYMGIPVPGEGHRKHDFYVEVLPPGPVGPAA